MPDQPSNPQNTPSDFVQKPVQPPSVAVTTNNTGLLPAAAARKTGLRDFYRDNRLYVWATVLGLVIIGVLAFLAFRKAPVTAPKEAKINVSVDVPSTVPAGGQAIYKIKVENQDTQKLTKISLELGYPQGVTFQSSSPNPQNLSGTTFAVPDLVPGQNAVVIVKTQASGNVNDVKELAVKLHYSFSNFNSDFLKIQTASFRLTASDVTLELNGPQSTSNAQLVVYTLKYGNNSANIISHGRIQMDYPDGFVFGSADPRPDSGSNIWNIDQLAPAGSGTITIQGTFNSSNPGESKTATANFLIPGSDGQYFVQNSSSFTTSLASLPLLVSQELESGPKNMAVANPGDNLSFAVKYQNNAPVVATGVNVVVTLNSKVLDLSSIQAEGAQVNNNSIMWNAASVTQLASLNPNDSGTLRFSVAIKDPAVKDSSKNLTVVSDVKIKSNEYETYFPGNQLSVKISSPMKLGEALAYQSGSLPPQVGKPTLYSVTLTLTNSNNDFSNGELTAFIPLGAGGFVSGSVNAAESGKVDYDATTGKLAWHVGPLPAHTGQFTVPRTLQFGVRLTPSASQAGEQPTLVKGIAFTATDTFTNQSVQSSADNLTTGDLPDRNNGSVQR